MDTDTYKTIASATEAVLFKDKNSKFFGYVYPIDTEKNVKDIIEALKKQHHNARHWCYAYQLGMDEVYFRANDDGEPDNTAGMPIYGQIQSFKVTNVLVVVVRYFGGIKLGASGLINAYKTTAQMALASAQIIEKTINVHCIITFDYKHLNKVMRVVKEKNLTIVNQKMEESCEMEISIRKKNAEMVCGIFNSMFEVYIKPKA